MKRQREKPAVRCRTIQNNSIYVVMEIMLEKRKYVKIQYNTDNIQMMCIQNVSYSTVT